MVSFKRLFLFIFTFFLVLSVAQEKRVMTFEDVMKFKKIKDFGLSAKGNMFYHTADPDRGDSRLHLKNFSENKKFSIERGFGGKFTDNEKWFASFIRPEFLKLNKIKKSKPKNDLVVLNTSSGDTLIEKSVKKFQFFKDSEWIAIHFNKPGKAKKDSKTGSKLLLKELGRDYSHELEFVTSFAVDSSARFMAYTVADTSKEKNGLYILDLDEKRTTPIALDVRKNGNYANLSWNKKSELVFTRSEFLKKGETEKADLMFWSGGLKDLVTKNDYPQNWIIPSKNKVFWSKDGNTIFFGFKPFVEKEKKKTDSTDIYNFDNILSDKEVDVWHWDDPLIKTNEKVEYKKNKDKTFAAAYNFKEEKFVQLADKEMKGITLKKDQNKFLGWSQKPYQKLKTWSGSFADYYVTDLKTGKREKFAEKLYDFVSLSSDGKFAVYFFDKEWYLYNVDKKETVNLTSKIETPFEDEDHDYPREVNSYGFGGWINKSESFLIYDKFDIWKFSTRSFKGENLTKSEGRKNFLQFRVMKLNKKARFFKSDEELLVRAYNDKEKYTAIYKLDLDNNKLEALTENYKKFTIKAKAEKSDKILFTRESYREYPDFWITDSDFDSPEKITDLGKQIKEFKWGTPELIDWLSADGTPIQGILIKPENFDPAKKYPVFVYYYRFFTPRMYNFPDIVVNHRPNYGVYSSHDYVIFLPDIRFEIGRPGLSAVKCLVPGIHKLIEMGIADPDKVGLHGHSWSGYQTAFVVTQTDIFKCAVAGAPVSNMTSAYSGIRWGTGLARQFQYEKTQSRIGASLFESPHLYIENSPVFFADRINTPLLIQHGDIDEAVPWYQSIELYLAMRRLNKDCIFLQYRGEPHHLKKYPNKLDYSIKMKEYFDYHLKGEKPAEWIINGVPVTK